MAKSVAKLDKISVIVYPPGCKELTEDLGKDELVKRLKLLARAFQDMGQDDNEQYTGLALLIASDVYMEHSSKDVRLLVACCIADVFRIFAPEAPYKEQEQLKEIFMFLIQQLRGLEDPELPSFKRYFYLLENLSWVKSFNICIELDDNQEIFCALFKLMFSIVSDKHSGKVRTFMLDMMTPLVCEADSVSQELLDIILMNLVEPKKGHNKIAYQMARDLVKRTSNSIEPYIQAFFNNMLMLGKTSESEVSNHLYDLIYELNQVAPNVLYAVLPQLEFKLKSNEEHERKSVTKLLAKMFSEQNSDLALKNKALWNCFLGRFNDICIGIRTTCVQFAQMFILNHPELVKDVLEQLKVRQHDPEENVRMEVVNCMLQVARKDFSVCTDEMLVFIRERTLDKKFKIRREALLGLGCIYKSVMSRDPVDPQQASRVDWIRNKVFHHYYQNSNDDRLLVERILNIHLVPYTLPVADRMKKLLELFCTLDENAFKAFSEMLKHRCNVRLIVQQLLDAHDKQNEPNPPHIFPKLASLARTLPELQKPNEYIKKLNMSLREDRRMRQLFTTLVGTDCTCKKAEDTVKEILRKVGGTGAVQNQFYFCLVKSLLERIAPVMIDSQAIKELVTMVKELTTGLGSLADIVENPSEKGIKLLLVLAHAYPHHFKTAEVYEDLLTFLKHDDDFVCDCTLQILALTGAGLEQQYPEVYSTLIPVLSHLAKMGTPKQTKHALRCINVICSTNEPILQQVFEHVQKSLNPESANYITSIVALGHLALLCPSTFSSEMKNIVTKTIVKDLLMQDRTAGPTTDEGWYADHLVTEETQAKVHAMKLLVRWLLGLKSNSNNSATSTLRLLYTVIIHEGDLMEHHHLNKPELARLRLQAGCCMMKLAEETCFAEIITKEQFQALALLINDSCYHVRVRFALKLHKGLLSLRLPLEYMSIFSLAANDPLKERRNQLKLFLNNNVQKRRDYVKQNVNPRGLMASVLPDYVLPYTIHLLAHDPDFKSFDHVDSLKNLKECLWFVMEPLVGRTEDYNYAFLRRMIEKIKQTKDAQGPDDEAMNKKLYAVSDLALGLLNVKSTNITLKDSNVDPPLPSKLFTSPDKAYKNLQSYLPKDFQFDSKRRFPPSVVGGKAHTTTEILVMSHAPIVNPMPRTPRITKKSLREQAKQDSQHLSESSEQESDANNSGDISADSVESSKSPSHSGRRSSQTSSSEDPKPVKAGTKQTKMEDFSSAKTKSGDKDSVVNGSSKNTSRRSARAGVEGGESEDTSKAATQEQTKAPVAARKRRASDEGGSTAANKGGSIAAKRVKGAAAPQAETKNQPAKKQAPGSIKNEETQEPASRGGSRPSAKSPSPTQEPASRGGRHRAKSPSPTQEPASRGGRHRAKSSSPTPSSPQRSLPPKKARLAKGDTKDEPEPALCPSTSTSRDSTNPALCPSTSTSRDSTNPALCPSTSTSRDSSNPALCPSTSTSRDSTNPAAAKRGAPARNVRRAKPLSNGTSDGEEHNTQDSDSQTSESQASKQAELTRALELRPIAQAQAPVPPVQLKAEEDEETLNSRRRATRPKKK